MQPYALVISGGMEASSLLYLLSPQDRAPLLELEPKQAEWGKRGQDNMSLTCLGVRGPKHGG